MLTIKGPIQLHIAQSLTGNMEAFGERIRGNYGLLGARFAAKDLLFLMTAPPDLPEDVGGMTTLVSQQSSTDVRTITMEVVNNVVNRILLDGTEQFTYQDQVYITTVLNRLGINHVAQFMSQVRQLRLENESTVHMIRIYQEELEHIFQRQVAGEAVPELPLPVGREEDAHVPPRDPRVTLCMEILKRLDTANLYETVHTFQRSWSNGNNVFRNQELKLSEHIRFSNAVSLAEIKQQVYQQPDLHLLHHLNAYETGGLLEVPKDEEEVLSQAAAAALITAVDNTVVEVLNRPRSHQEQWIHIQNALWQVAENTLSRFETYYSQPQPPVDLSIRTDAAWNNYIQELKEYQKLYWQIYPKAAARFFPPMDRDQGGTALMHLAKSDSTEETRWEHSVTLHETDTEGHRLETTLRENWQKTLRERRSDVIQVPEKGSVSEGETAHLTYWIEDREGDHLQKQEYIENIHIHNQPSAATKQAEVPVGHISEADEPADREILVRQERERQIASEQMQKIIQQQLQKSGTPPVPQGEALQMISALHQEDLGEDGSGIIGGAFSEKIKQEKYIIRENDREVQRQTIREPLRPAEAIPDRPVMPPAKPWSIAHWHKLRKVDLLHRLEKGEQLTIEEQTAVRELITAQEIQHLWTTMVCSQLGRQEKRIVRERRWESGKNWE